jgi:hypothetical protein
MNFEKNHIQIIGAIITHTIDNMSFVINGAWVNLPKVGFLGCAYFVKINSCPLNKTPLNHHKEHEFFLSFSTIQIH